jgi:hypothetical protein
MTLEVEFLGEFESIFETALDQGSEDLLGTFGEITLDKKSHATVSLSTLCEQCQNTFNTRKIKFPPSGTYFLWTLFPENRTSSQISMAGNSKISFTADF